LKPNSKPAALIAILPDHYFDTASGGLWRALAGFISNNNWLLWLLCMAINCNYPTLAMELSA
jgi:hypothetical protein